MTASTPSFSLSFEPGGRAAPLPAVAAQASCLPSTRSCQSQSIPPVYSCSLKHGPLRFRRFHSGFSVVLGESANQTLLVWTVHHLVRAWNVLVVGGAPLHSLFVSPARPARGAVVPNGEVRRLDLLGQLLHAMLLARVRIVLIHIGSAILTVMPA